MATYPVGMGLLSAETPRDTVVAWVFVAVQFALLVAIVVLPTGSAWSVPFALDRVALVAELLGAALIVGGIVGLGRSLTPLPSPIAHGELREGGMYRWVRHPIYSGIMLLGIGVAVRSASIAVAVTAFALVAWLTVKARWEERRLGPRYPGYGEYAARTPRFVPGWPVRSGPATKPDRLESS
jgi:protein-S-isoprenylcysteine O-methyltransferase Ste14